jgi:LmbE family N-acetylglucosaminyl deacetylase
MSELPEDRGAAGLAQILRKLGTTARMMQTTAHPDDEDGGMLTYESRGLGVDVLLMTLNRGEGGQNRLGSGFSDGLGVLRTLELLAADQYYGVDERFSRAADFGFSKTADETFQKWGGHDLVLADMVRVIRSDRPDVLVARFSGTTRDGHGHHQASALLTKEAFRAAADPKRFPQQIAAGLLPWQARKLYVGNVCDFGAQSCTDANWTLKINSGKPSKELGTSYVQFAMKGLRHQLSQGAASWNVEPGDRFTFYKLVDSVEPPALDKSGHEQGFFDGINTSWSGLAERFALNDKAIPNFRNEMDSVQSLLTTATTQAASAPESAAPTLSRLAGKLSEVAAEVKRSTLPADHKLPLLQILNEKRAQAETALRLALDLQLSAEISPLQGGALVKIPREEDAHATVSPGEEFLVTIALHNGSTRAVHMKHTALDFPADWKSSGDFKGPADLAAGGEVRWIFRVHVPLTAPSTKPYWHRDNPDVEGVNHVDAEAEATLPFPAPHLNARVEYSLRDAGGAPSNEIAARLVAPYLGGDPPGVHARPVAVVPAFSVQLEPGTLVTTTGGAKAKVTVGVTNSGSASAQGTLRLELPAGWHSDPEQYDVQFSRRGEKKQLTFALRPGSLSEGRASIHAVFRAAGKDYSEGYSLVTRNDLGSFHYYQPALLRVSTVAVKLPDSLVVGYVTGAGDDIPETLKQLGIEIHVIAPEQLAGEDLSRYRTIVLGIRAYDTQKAIASANQRLLDWVSAGGTLIVQYNADTGNFNSGHFTPYPATLSRARVSVEEAPVTVLAPDDGVFHFPNTIMASDFDGWVQERGLYFMDKWDDHFQPLLACNDPGEDVQKGGLLRAKYGKGVYIYTGYAFFRQLPAGVPGAIRLFVNLLSQKQ